MIGLYRFGRLSDGLFVRDVASHAAHACFAQISRNGSTWKIKHHDAVAALEEQARTRQSDAARTARDDTD